MKTVFWIIVAISTGYYNGGTLTSLNVPFPSEAACIAARDQIQDAWGRTTLSCVKVEEGKVMEAGK